MGRPARNESGAIAVIVALLAVVLMGFAALVVDIGQALETKARAQDAVDAAALAGARDMSADGGSMSPAAMATDVARLITDNVGRTRLRNCLAPPSGFTAVRPCIAYKSSGPGEYQVAVQFPPRKVSTTFGGIFGVSSITVDPVSMAQSGAAPLSPCSPCDPPLDAGGTPTVTPVMIPADVMSAMPADPTSVTPDISPPDPCPAPGLYEAQTVTVAGSCLLMPGLYVFDNSAVTVTGALTNDLAAASGQGVTLAFYGTGSLTISSGGSLRIAATPATTAPSNDPFPAISGTAVVFAGGDTQPFDLGDGFSIDGSLYAPDAVWTTSSDECVPMGATRCTLTGSLAVGHTAFEDGLVPTVGPAPTEPEMAKPHLITYPKAAS